MTDEGTTQQIVIDGKTFKAVKTINLTKETTLCKRRVEDQTEMSDHAIQNPAIFEFELELLNSENEYNILDDLQDKKTLFDLLTHRGQYSNMFIVSLSDRKASQQANTTTATIKVQQVLVGKVSTAPFTQSKALGEVATLSEDAYPGSATLKYTVIGKWPDTVVPARDPEKTIVQHCDGLAGKIDALRSMNKMVPKV
ncbi:MAG: hypothetical protein CW742_15325 [Methanoregula sp.]|nr:MAG: hypothetical protein CW742_15325 [Methanoregula sp.]